MPLFSNYRQLLRYYIISYDVAGVFNVIKTSNVAIPWIENRLRFSVVATLGLGSRGFRLVAGCPSW